MNATAEPTITMPPSPSLNTIDGLLRDRKGLLDRIERGDDLNDLARTMTLTIAVSVAVFGATLGYYRGGLQILFAAIKLPLVVLLTAALATPAFSALCAAFSGKTDVRRDFALVLSSLALASLLIMAAAPVVLLAEAVHFGYHRITLLVVACCAAGGAGGLTLFFAGLRRRQLPNRFLISALLLGVFCAVGSQMAWTLRPYLVRPRTVSAPFVRGVEGSFIESVAITLESAQGRYSRQAAPMPGQWDMSRPPEPTQAAPVAVPTEAPMAPARPAAEPAPRTHSGDWEVNP